MIKPFQGPVSQVDKEVAEKYGLNKPKQPDPVLMPYDVVTASPRYEKGLITHVIIQVPAEHFKQLGQSLKRLKTPELKELGTKLVEVSKQRAI